jgi:hypothetical protein
MLAEHPKVLERLRKEILETVGESDRPSYDDVKDMKYMRAVINGKFLPSPSSQHTLKISQKLFDCSLPCKHIFVAYLPRDCSQEGPT